MARREFSKEVKRAALKRSGMKCEAVGDMYGFDPGQRCGVNLNVGVQYDHIIADSIGGEPTLDNCAAVCMSCHGYKTRTVDTPRAAKTKRISDKAKGISRPSSKLAAKDKPAKTLSKPLPPRKRDIFGRPVSEGARA